VTAEGRVGLSPIVVRRADVRSSTSAFRRVPCAQSRGDRHLLPVAYRTRQKKICYIDAPNQQQPSHRGQQDEQRSTIVAHQRLLKRCQQRG